MFQLISACRLNKDLLLSEILRYLIFKGPATAYRIARDLNLHFTQSYRKVSRLEHFGLVRRIDNHRGDVFEATERGIVACYYFGCAPWDLLLDKLAARHRLPKTAIKRFLDEYLDYFKSHGVLDDFPVMVFYAVYKGMPVSTELVLAASRHLSIPQLSY